MLSKVKGSEKKTKIGRAGRVYHTGGRFSIEEGGYLLYTMTDTCLWLYYDYDYILWLIF